MLIMVDLLADPLLNALTFDKEKRRYFILTKFSLKRKKTIVFKVNY